MAEVIFIYDKQNISIQCEINDKMKDIIDKFLLSISKEGNNFNYLYNEQEINYNLSFIEQANESDRDRKIMNIIVNDIDKNDKKIDEEENLNELEVHNDENPLINLNNFIKLKEIGIGKIICNICNVFDKSITNNNEFYICNTCNKNICPFCRTIHDKNHYIINYDDKNNICRKHKEQFTKYCKTCTEDICIKCENNHNEHEIIDYSKLLIEKNDIIKSIEILNNEKEKFKTKIKNIKDILDTILEKVELSDKINNDTINNYNINIRNYENLQNLNNLKNNNDVFSKYLENINNNKHIFEIFKSQNDKFYEIDGNIYFGEMENDLKEGKGILYYNKNDKLNRKKYEGNYRNDKKGKVFYIIIMEINI